MPHCGHKRGEYTEAVKTLSIFAFSLLLLTGCSKAPETSEAVKKGIITDLAKKVDVNNMDVQVTSIAFHGDTADAMVNFAPKGQPNAGMQMRYTMEKKEDGWHIAARKGNVAAHGGATASGVPAVPGGAAAGGEMPAGHPPVDPSSLPPAKQ